MYLLVDIHAHDTDVNDTAKSWMVGCRRKCLCDGASASRIIEMSAYATPLFLPSFLLESPFTYHFLLSRSTLFAIFDTRL